MLKRDAQKVAGQSCVSAKHCQSGARNFQDTPPSNAMRNAYCRMRYFSPQLKVANFRPPSNEIPHFFGETHITQFHYL